MTPAARALARRAFGDARVRTASFAVFFALVAIVQVVAYRRSFPTIADRIAFARGFGDEKTVRFIYGLPHDLLTTGGYVAWRVGGVLSIIAAAWGLLAAVAALRGEEETGRREIVLAGRITRPQAYVAAMLAVGGGALVLAAALFAALAGGGLDPGGAAFLAVAALSPALVFAGVGALTSQLVPSRRLALEAGAGVLVVSLLMRVAADTASGWEWLRWLTPLGWVEEMRAFAGPRPVLLLLPLAAGAVLLVAAGVLDARRDVGAALLRVSDSAPPNLRLLSSPTAQALRAERGSLLAWLLGIGFFAVVIGVLSDSFTTRNLSESLRERLEQVGGASVVTPTGALGLYFLFFVLAVCLFACSQISAARREEAEGRLETLFALAVSRRAWLGGRLLLGAAAAAVLALAAGVLAWAGAASQGADVALVRMLEAGANCLPAALLFLAVGALAFALVPRAAAGIAYLLVGLAFLWELVGALLEAPDWTLALSPFHGVGLVPAQPFQATEAIVMIALALVAALAAVAVFERRDLASG